MTLEQVAVVAVAIAAWFFFFRYGKTSSPEARRLVAAGARLVDVRTPGEFSGGALPGAQNIPLDRIEARVAELKGEPSPIVVYCASGMRSGQARRILLRHGIPDVHDLGGMSRW